MVLLKSQVMGNAVFQLLIEWFFQRYFSIFFLYLYSDTKSVFIHSNIQTSIVVVKLISKIRNV